MPVSEKKMHEMFDRAAAIRKAHPYRKNKKVMVGSYELFFVGELGSIGFLSAQRWEIEEALLIQRSFGHQVIAVSLEEPREERLP